MESEVTALVGAERHERSDDRVPCRDGSRVRSRDTRVGTVELAILEVRPGTYFPSLLQPRRRAEQACRRWCRKPGSTASWDSTNWEDWLLR